MRGSCLSVWSRTRTRWRGEDGLGPSVAYAALGGIATVLLSAARGFELLTTGAFG